MTNEKLIVKSGRRRSEFPVPPVLGVKQASATAISPAQRKWPPLTVHVCR